MRLPAVAIALLAIVSAARPAIAGDDVGLVAVPAGLDHALRGALEPWGLQLRALDDAVPVDLDAARALAARAGVRALVWVAASSMWVYDSQDRQLSQRRLPAGADEATTAGLALAVKAMLRATPVAPPAERFGAAPVVPVRAPRSSLRIAIGGGWRRGPIGSAGEPRVDVAIAWWRARLGAIAGLSSGTGVATDGAMLLARLTDTTLFAAFGTRRPFGTRLAAEASLGLSVHLTALDGFAPAHDQAVAVGRTDGAIDAGVAAVLALGASADLGLDLGMSAALRRQRYLIDGEPVLELPEIAVSAGLSLRVRVP